MSKRVFFLPTQKRRDKQQYSGPIKVIKTKLHSGKVNLADVIVTEQMMTKITQKGDIYNGWLDYLEHSGKDQYYQQNYKQNMTILLVNY